MKFVFDMQHPYLQALRAIQRRQRRFKRQGKVYTGIKAPTDRETIRKVLMWKYERRREQKAWEETRALIAHLRCRPGLRIVPSGFNQRVDPPELGRPRSWE